MAKDPTQNEIRLQKAVDRIELGIVVGIGVITDEVLSLLPAPINVITFCCPNL